MSQLGILAKWIFPDGYSHQAVINKGVNTTLGVVATSIIVHFEKPHELFASPRQSWHHPNLDRVPRHVPVVDDAPASPQVGDTRATAEDTIELHVKVYALSNMFSADI